GEPGLPSRSSVAINSYRGPSCPPRVASSPVAPSTLETSWPSMDWAEGPGSRSGELAAAIPSIQAAMTRRRSRGRARERNPETDGEARDHRRPAHGGAADCLPDAFRPGARESSPPRPEVRNAGAGAQGNAPTGASGYSVGASCRASGAPSTLSACPDHRAPVSVGGGG